MLSDSTELLLGLSLIHYILWPKFNPTKLAKIITHIFNAYYLVARISPVGRRESCIGVAIQRPPKQQYKWLWFVNLIVDPSSTLLNSF